MQVDNRFTVKVVNKGDSYGRNGVLTHDKDEPLVEFYDDKYNQFVSRYYMTTMLEHGAYGLNLQGDVPAWKISRYGMQEVQEYLRNL